MTAPERDPAVTAWETATTACVVAAARRHVRRPDPRRQGGTVVNAPLTPEEPITPGWYAYSGGAQTMLFHLRETGQWSAHLDNGSSGDCDWGYIEQALSVFDLVRVQPNAVEDLTEAIRLTVEYVGTETLRPIEGWSWYDALLKYAPEKVSPFVEQTDLTVASAR